MPGGLARDGSGSKWTRMWFDQDMANCNVRREHLAHCVHYKVDVMWMKHLARELGRPIDILNVGCGEANELRMFYTADQTKKTAVVNSYLGIDGDPQVVDRTNEKARTVLRGCNGSVEKCDITSEEFPCDPRSMDLIISNEVLEHIPREAVAGVLRKIRRAARREAVILISTPNKDGTNERLPADHIYEHGYQEIQDEFEEAGLEVVDHLGVYIKLSNLRRYLREHGSPEVLDYASNLWDRFGLDIGSMMTADLAKPVANNCIWILRKAVR